MKNAKSILIAAVLATVVCLCQAQELPRTSPKASVEQIVGLTKISVSYSRPAVKERAIWGDVVPYDKVWRAGANEATLFSTDEAIEVNGQPLAQGTYAFFVLPKKDAPWQVIFNSKTDQWGANDRNPDDDVLVVSVEPIATKCKTERMEFRFTDVGFEKATLALQWDMLSIPLDITVFPNSRIKTNIQSALDAAQESERWSVYRNAARYAKEKGDMVETGLTWIEEANKLKETWYGLWLHADLLAQKKDYSAATTMGQKAIEKGESEAKESGESFKYATEMQEKIDVWKAEKR